MHCLNFFVDKPLPTPKRKNSSANEALPIPKRKKIDCESQLIFCTKCAEHSIIMEGKNAERHTCREVIDPEKVKKCLNILKGLLPAEPVMAPIVSTATTTTTTSNAIATKNLFNTTTSSTAIIINNAETQTSEANNTRTPKRRFPR